MGIENSGNEVSPDTNEGVDKNTNTESIDFSEKSVLEVKAKYEDVNLDALQNVSASIKEEINEDITALQELNTELKAVQFNQRQTVESLFQNRQNLSQSIKKNPKFYEFWKPGAMSADLNTELDLSRLKGSEQAFKENQEKIDKLQRKIIECKKGMYMRAYEYVKKEGGNTSKFALSVFEDLGDETPKDLLIEVGDERRKLIKNGGLTKFQEKYYKDDYSGALKALAEENAEKSKAVGGKLSEYDVISLLKNPENIVEQPEFKEGTLGAQKITEGYSELKLPAYLSGKKSLLRVLVKEEDDGSIKYLTVADQGDKFEPIMLKAGFSSEEKSIPAEKIPEIERDGIEMQKNFLNVIKRNPVLKKFADTSALLQNRFQPLYELFQSGIKGGKTENFVEYAREKARDLKSVMGANGLNGVVIADALKELNTLEKFSKTGLPDEFERQIADLRKGLMETAKNIENRTVETMCDQILDKGIFNEDTFLDWIKTDGLVFMATIAAAVTTTVTIVGVFALPGIAGWAITAGAGTLGGMAGSEIGHQISESLGGDKSLLFKFVDGDKVFNPKTKRYENVEMTDLGKIYGIQFASGFVTTFAMLGLGQSAGGFLRKFAEKNATKTGMKGLGSRLIKKLPRMQPKQVDLLTKKGYSHVLKKLGGEIMDETGEEFIEQTAERLSEYAGFIASLYHCMHGGHAKYKVAGMDVVAEKVDRASGSMNFSFDISQIDALEASLKSRYSNVERVSDNELKVQIKGGASMRFSGASENLLMRELKNEGRDLTDEQNGKFETLYGITQIAENTYQFQDFAPKENISISQYLIGKGFHIQQNSDGSGFSAMKNGKRLHFTGEMKVEPEKNAKTKKTPGSYLKQLLTEEKGFWGIGKMKKPVYEKGHIVSVKSKSGRIEGGWKIINFVDGKYILAKSIGDNSMIKNATEKELKGWQKEATEQREIRIEQQKYFDELSPEKRKLLKELFPEGIEKSHFEQGNTGNCYLLAALHVLKRHPVAPYVLARMISREGKGWKVNFPNGPSILVKPEDLNGQWVYDPKDEDADKDGYIFKKTLRTGQIGDKILVVAYGRMRKELFVNKPSVKENKKQYTMLAVEGGFSTEAFGHLLNDITTDIDHAGNYYGDMLYKSSRKMRKVEQVFQSFADNPKNYLLTANIPNLGKKAYFDSAGNEYADSKLRFPTAHAYSVTAVNPKKRTVTVVNPHGTKKQTYELSYKEFFQYFTEINFAKLDPSKIQGLDFMKEDHLEAVFKEKLMPSLSYKYSLDSPKDVYLSQEYMIRCSLSADNTMNVYLGNGFYTLHPDQEIIVGRDSIGGHSTVSALHAKIKYLGGNEFSITDLNSSNGTYVYETGKDRVIIEKNKFEQPEFQNGIFNEKLTPKINYDYQVGNGITLNLADSFDLKVMAEPISDNIILQFGPNDFFMVKAGKSIDIGRNEFPGLPQTISSRHLTLMNQGGGVINIVDNNSTNGTSVKNLSANIDMMEDVIKNHQGKLKKGEDYAYNLDNQDLYLQMAPGFKGGLHIRVEKQGDIFAIELAKGDFIYLKPGEAEAVGRELRDYFPNRVSSRHVQLINENGVLIVNDLSTNGTSAILYNK